MFKFRFILLLFILFTSSLLCEAGKKYRWEKLPLNEKGQLLFVSGTSVEDFRVQTIQGTLIEVKNNKIKKHIFPTDIKLLNSKYFQISENDFFFIGTTLDWKGVIYRVRNNEWEKYKIKIPYPIRDILKTNNKFYIIGDFGLLFELINNQWKIISTPFGSHCMAAIPNGNSIIISTKADGIYKFDGMTFQKLEGIYDFEFSTILKKIGKTIYIYTIDNKLLSIKDSRLFSEKNTKILKYFIDEQSGNFGFNSKLIYYKGVTERIYFPQYMNIVAIQKFDDGTVLLFSKNGNLYRSIDKNELSFVDLAPIYKVDYLPNSENISAQFFDANNDGIEDLIVINKSVRNYLALFQGVKNSSFADITSISQLPFNQFPINFISVADFNKDGLNDIALQVRKDNKQKLLLYENQENFKFKFADEINLLDDFQALGIRSLSSFDYDFDGDEDIIVTSYYGKKDNPGFVAIYQNNLWGNFDNIDTTLKYLTKHWNEKIVFVDLNNDDVIDIFDATSWTHDYILIGKSGKYVDETEFRFPEQVKTGTVDVLLSDFDNDADLDVFTVGRGDFIRVYQNNGEGFFTEITNKLFNANILKKDIRYSSNLNFGDFNNDGFVDLIVSISFPDSEKTSLFINKNGKIFEEAEFVFENSSAFLLHSTITDVDNDGDLDIYGTTNNRNALWVNSYDKKNSIKIKLKGIASATNALGSKIWVYEKNKINDKNALLGFKQLGTEAIGKYAANSFILHFGLGKVEECDIKIKFPSGKEVVMPRVKSGSFVTIQEYPVIASFIYHMPGNLYRFIKNGNNQIYLTVIIFSHIFILLGLWYGFNKLNWTPKLTLSFAVLNISLFWISLYFASFSLIPPTKFFAPLLLTFLVTIIPLALFRWFNKSNKKDITGYNERLLKLMRSFSHGEWALRNLNSILFLCENSPTDWNENSEFHQKLEIRFKTFTEMTSVSIKEIVELEKLSGNQSEELSACEKSLNKIIDKISDFNNESSLHQISENITILRTHLKEFRNNIYTRFSSNPIEVINNLITNFETTFTETHITIKKSKRYPNDIPVLIKSYELGDILDNLFQNSIKFMKDSIEKKISIELFKDSPKIIITLSNSGSIIPKDKWDVIFEHGYSESNSTGQGLFTAREVLAKYGGRIYVDCSVSKKTTFKIELNEGVEKII